MLIMVMYLVEERWHSKDNQLCCYLVVAWFDQWVVHMSERKEIKWERERDREEADSPRSPPMYRDVPILPESPNVLSIPPVSIELSVCEAEQLSSEIHHRMKHPVESKQPEEMVWQLFKKMNAKVTWPQVVWGQRLSTCGEYTLFPRAD